jgi:hypothetical protein
MMQERFSPGVRPEVREQRGRELDGLAAEEVRLSQDLTSRGRADLGRLSELFAVASSTAEVRAAEIPPDHIDQGTIRRAVMGQL